MKEKRRAEVEKQLVYRMIDLYCRDHPDEELCKEPSALKQYAGDRIDHCPFGDDKTACKNCPIHCYREPEKTLIRDVMRYAGPRIILHAPIKTIRYLRMKILNRLKHPSRKKKS